MLDFIVCNLCATNQQKIVTQMYDCLRSTVSKFELNPPSHSFWLLSLHYALAVGKTKQRKKVFAHVQMGGEKRRAQRLILLGIGGRCFCSKLLPTNREFGTIRDLNCFIHFILSHPPLHHLEQVFPLRSASRGNLHIPPPSTSPSPPPPPPSPSPSYRHHQNASLDVLGHLFMPK